MVILNSIRIENLLNAALNGLANVTEDGDAHLGGQVGEVRATSVVVLNGISTQLKVVQSSG